MVLIFQIFYCFHKTMCKRREDGESGRRQLNIFNNWYLISSDIWVTEAVNL